MAETNMLTKADAGMEELEPLFCVYVCGHVCAKVHVWRPEDNFESFQGLLGLQNYVMTICGNVEHITQNKK